MGYPLCLTELDIGRKVALRTQLGKTFSGRLVEVRDGNTEYGINTPPGVYINTSTSLSTGLFGPISDSDQVTFLEPFSIFGYPRLFSEGF